MTLGGKELNPLAKNKTTIVILSIIFSESDDPLSICLQVLGFNEMG